MSPDKNLKKNKSNNNNNYYYDASHNLLHSGFLPGIKDNVGSFTFSLLLSPATSLVWVPVTKQINSKFVNDYD